MKTCIIPDLHGSSIWKSIVHKENPDRVVFLGDYFDSFDISGIEQIHNFKEIIEYKETSGKEVIMLIGNHDYHYYPEIGYNGTSGYQTKIAPSITQVIQENRYHLQMAYQFDEFLFTHAGVSPVFMNDVFGIDDWDQDNVAYELNEMFKYKPKAFTFYGTDPHGDNQCQTPIWIRPRSLMAANNKKDKVSLKHKYIQVVGHTQQRQIDIQGKSTGGRYYFVDCLPTSSEYMIIDNGVISFDKIN